LPTEPGVDGATEALASVLRRMGLVPEIEADGAMALVRLAGPASMPSAEQRAAIVAAARAAGFVTVALELPADSGVA
jgi:hypothetical protein